MRRVERRSRERANGPPARPRSDPARERSEFARYRRTGDPELRRRLIERHLPLAQRLARRYARSSGALEDLVQVAALGLVKAVDRFDPDRGASFSSFAAPTIIGEVKRHFRDTRWALHVPRELQERAQRVDRARADLTPRLGRSPSVGEVGAALGIPAEDVIEAQAAFAGYDAASLDAPLGHEGANVETAAEAIGDLDPGYEVVEDLASIEGTFTALPGRAREVLRLHFVEDMTQAQIGRRLEISQMHVSRILRRSLQRLRTAAEAA